MASNPMMMQQGGMPMMQPAGGGMAQPPQQGVGPADLIAQLAAMPPAQALRLVEMNMQRAQQQQNPQELAIWQQVAQLLQAAGQQPSNPVTQTLNAGFGG